MLTSLGRSGTSRRAPLSPACHVAARPRPRERRRPNGTIGWAAAEFSARAAAVGVDGGGAVPEPPAGIVPAAAAPRRRTPTSSVCVPARRVSGSSVTEGARRAPAGAASALRERAARIQLALATRPEVYLSIRRGLVRLRIEQPYRGEPVQFMLVFSRRSACARQGMAVMGKYAQGARPREEAAPRLPLAARLRTARPRARRRAVRHRRAVPRDEGARRRDLDRRGGRPRGGARDRQALSAHESGRTTEVHAIAAGRYVFDDSEKGRPFILSVPPRARVSSPTPPWGAR